MESYLNNPSDPKTPFSHRGLARQVTSSVVTAVAAGFLIICVFYAGESLSLAKKELQDRGAAVAEAFATSHLETLLLRDYPILESSAKTLLANNSDILWVAISAEDGRQISQIGSEPDNSALVVRHQMTYKGKHLGQVELGLSPEARHKEIRRHLLVIAAMGIIITILLSVALILALKKQVLFPVEELHHFASRLRSGDWDYRVKVKHSHELGDLTAMLNQMAQDIQVFQKTLKQERDLLESRVQERTRELSQSLEKLKQAQIQLLESSKMAAVGSLAAGMAHEMNNPMGVILGFAQTIAKRVKEGDPLSLPAKSIEREAIRCKTLVQSLLTFSRQGITPRRPADLNKLVQECLSALEMPARERNVEIVKNLGVDLPLLMVNRDQISQVLAALCHNSLDAMSQGGGRMTIVTEKISKEGSPFVQVTISDTGPGIPEEILPKIFEPFFTTKEPGQGTGLGLALAYEIVQQHGGQIECTSRLHQGVSMKVILPLTKPESHVIKVLKAS